MSGLFGTFNIAKRGLFAQQKAIDVTSHNIANANTEGYSRQRVDLQTTRPQWMPSMSNAVGPGQMGTGVEVASITRVRDSFLDYQTRVEKGVSGRYQGRDKFLSQVENILNEPSDVGISTLMTKFYNSWSILSGTQADKSNAKAVVMQQSQALANELNHTYNELTSLKDSTQEIIKNTVFEVNNMLNQVSQVNQEIKQVKVAGNNPNDLMDKRDNLLDQLSSKFGLTIDRKQFEGIDVTTNNDGKKLEAGDNGTPPLAADGKTPLNLVQIINPDDVCKFSYVSKIEAQKDAAGVSTGKYNITYYPSGDSNTPKNIELTMNEDEAKQLDQCRVLWSDKNGAPYSVDPSGKVLGLLKNGDSFSNVKMFTPPSGELKGYMSVQKDIDAYQERLNKLAKGLAFSVNAIYTQSDTFKDTDDNLFVNGTAYDATNKKYLKEEEITAENISINKKLLDNPSLVMTGKDATSGESDGTRALAISQLRDKLLNIANIDPKTTDRKIFLGGKFGADTNLGGISNIQNATGAMTSDGYFKDMVNSLGIQEQEAKRMVINQEVLLAGFEESRASVSGVSLDEEMANLVQFQHCYQANAKIISTVDQLLEVVINGLKR